jgi:serine/threonine-protein kinase
VHKQGESFYITTIERNYKINQAIATFLGLLTEPKTTVELVDGMLALIQGATPEMLRPLVAKFLNDMYRLEIVRREGDTDVAALVQHYQPGMQLGHYRITDLLSLDDQFIQVYRAEDERTGQPVVLKMFSHTEAGIGNNKTLAKGRRQFEQEFALMRTLPRHPNVCQLLDFWAEPYPCAVLEYLPGDTLSRCLELGTIDPAHRPQLAAQALAGLAHVHQQGIVHGDIHPRNFMVHGEQATLIDFGFSYREGISNKEQLINRGGAAKYLAPERVSEHQYKFSKQAADFRAEVYQVGLVIYKLYVGSIPFEGGTWREMAAAILSHDFSTQLSPAVAHEQVLLRALRRDPAARYADAGELLAAWQQAVGLPATPVAALAC